MPSELLLSMMSISTTMCSTGLRSGECGGPLNTENSRAVSLYNHSARGQKGTAWSAANGAKNMSRLL